MCGYCLNGVVEEMELLLLPLLLLICYYGYFYFYDLFFLSLFFFLLTQPLADAVYYKNHDVIKLLEKHGANPLVCVCLLCGFFWIK